MSYLDKRQPIHAVRFFIFCISFLSAVCGPGCQSPRPSENSQRDSGTVVSITSSIPPYSTKEPERYQATRLVTFSEWSPADATPRERISRVLIARDGARRREEYLNGGKEHVVYLEIPAGQFVLLPSSSVYADLAATSNESEPKHESSEISPDLLINEKSGATYENLGAVMLDGRVTAKYRVTPSDRNNEAVSKVETLIWIDESIGLPVRSETTSSTAEYSSKVLMELKDIKLAAEERLFALPANYRKVEARLILDKIRAGK